MVLNMLPSASISVLVNGVKHSHCRNAVLLSYIAVARFWVSLAESLPSFQDQSLRQLRSALPFAAGSGFRLSPCSVPITGSHAPFYLGIRGIVAVRAKKEMRRIAAWRIIAFMTDEMTYWINLKLQKVAQPVSVVSFSVKAKLSVRPSLPLFAGSPFPAVTPRALARCFVNLAPKSLDVLFGKRGESTIRLSHDLKLLKQMFKLWLGSFDVSRIVRAVSILPRFADAEVK